MSVPKRRPLGRGLSALLPDQKPAKVKSSPEGDEPLPAFFHVAIEDVFPGPEQPRRQFGEAALEELAASIRAHGIIQPAIVRKRDDGHSGYFLIAGERRWRAAQRAGLREIPVVIHELDTRSAFERALVENLQRADLNAIEEAEAFQRLQAEFSYTQEQVAERVGKDRSTVANSLRLLKLPAKVRGMVETRELSMGHARALLGLDEAHDIETISRTIVAKDLSVRATEALIRQKTTGDPSPAKAKTKKSAAVRDLESRLTGELGARVEIRTAPNRKSGKIEIRYGNLDDLDRILEKLLRAKR